MNKTDFKIAAINYTAIKGQIKLFENKLIEHRKIMDEYLAYTKPHSFIDENFESEVNTLIKLVWGGNWVDAKLHQDSSLSQK